MKALVKYYESGIASAEVPEIVDLREEIDESTDIVEYAKIWNSRRRRNMLTST